MRKKFSVKIKTDININSLGCFLATFCFLFPVFFIDYINSFIQFIILGDLLLILLNMYKGNSRLKKENVLFIFAALTFCVIFNFLIYRKHWNFVLFYIVLFIQSILLAANTKKDNRIIILLASVFSGIHVFATLLIQVLPASASDSLIKIILPSKYVINQNWRITQGYNCGITAQPGSNALYIMIFFACVFAKYYVTKKDINLILCAISLVALFTTGKRSSLIIILLVVCYLMLVFRNIKIKRSTLLKIFTGCVAAIWGIYYLIAKTNIFSALVAKMNVAKDLGDVSGGRFLLWDAALKSFARNPILGAGIKYNYDVMGFDVHNVYLQYLSELGFVGFVLLVCMIISGIKVCKQNIKKINYDIIDHIDKECAVFSIYIFTYLLIYGFFGNTFVDYIPFELFIIVMSMCLAVKENDEEY